MSLIELIIYVLLLGAFLSGGLASAYGIFLSAQREYQQEIQKSQQKVVSMTELGSESEKTSKDANVSAGQNGFIALISVFSISAVLMMIALGVSMHHGNNFDIATHSEYRLIARQRAYACVDIAMMRIAQDYFYLVGVGSSPFISQANVSDLECTIERIYIPDLQKPYEKMIVASGSSGLNNNIRGRANTLVSFSGGTVSKLHENFIIY